MYLAVDGRRLDAGNTWVPVRDTAVLEVQCFAEGEYINTTGHFCRKAIAITKHNLLDILLFYTSTGLEEHELLISAEITYSTFDNMVEVKQLKLFCVTLNNLVTFCC